MTGEYDDQHLEDNPYGFTWHWTRPNGSPGGVVVERWGCIYGKGAALGIRGVGRQSPQLEVYVSDGGRSIQVFLDGERMGATR